MTLPDRAPSDWSTGAPKWAAVGVLTVAAALTAFFASSRQPNPLFRATPAPRAESQTVDASVRTNPSDRAHPDAPSRALDEAALTTDAPALTNDAPGIVNHAPGVTPGDAEPSPAPASESPSPDLETKLNVNSATAEQLQLLPGIGPTLAARIVAHRADHGPFRSLAELDRVPGIGPATLEKLRPHLEFK